MKRVKIHRPFEHVIDHDDLFQADLEVVEWADQFEVIIAGPREGAAVTI